MSKRLSLIRAHLAEARSLLEEVGKLPQHLEELYKRDPQTGKYTKSGNVCVSAVVNPENGRTAFVRTQFNTYVEVEWREKAGGYVVIQELSEKPSVLM